MRALSSHLAVLLALCSAPACSGWAGGEVAVTLPLVPLPWAVAVPADAAVEGIVRAADGAPLAGAQVCAWDLAAELSRRDSSAPVCAIAGTDGAYVLAGLAPSSHAVHASAPTFQPADHGRPVALRAGERRAGVDLTLGPGGVVLHGVVVDVDGEPIAGATVTNFETSDRYTLRGSGAVARSDIDGRFTLWVSPGIHMLFGAAEGMVDESMQLDTAGPPVRLVLAPESVLRGKVVDAQTGAPVAGARVQALRGPDSLWVAGVAFTDESGGFQVRRLPPGRYTLRAETGNRRGEGDRMVALGLGQTFELPPIGLGSLPSIRGRVTVAGDPALAGRGCPGGRAWLEDRHERPEPIDESGEFVFPALDPGEHTIHVHCPGLVSPGKLPPVQIERTPVTGLHWELAAGRTISGTVVDEQGRPVPALAVSAGTASSDLVVDLAGKTGVDANTDGAGRFEITGLSPGAFIVSTSDRPGTRMSVELPADRDIDGIRLVATALGEIRGTVVDERGAPVRGANVAIHGNGFGVAATTYMPFHVATRETGQFVIHGVRPGEYMISAQTPRTVGEGIPGPDVPGEPVRVLAGSNPEVRLVVPGEASAPIRGQVVRAGAPVAGAVVTARAMGPSDTEWVSPENLRWAWAWRDRITVTDAAGRFTVPDAFAGGTYLLQAYPRGGGASTLAAAAGSEVTLFVPETASLAGMITGPVERVPPVFTIRLAGGASGPITREFRHTAGRWGFVDLAPEEYAFALDSPSGYATETFELRAGEAREEVPLTLLAPGGLRGRVLDETGVPVGGADVFAVAAEPGSVAAEGISATTDSEGRFEIVGLRPGTVRVSVSRGTRDDTRDVTVERGRMSDVAIELRWR